MTIHASPGGGSPLPSIENDSRVNKLQDIVRPVTNVVGEAQPGILQMPSAPLGEARQSRQGGRAPNVGPVRHSPFNDPGCTVSIDITGEVWCWSSKTYTAQRLSGL